MERREFVTLCATSAAAAAVPEARGESLSARMYSRAKLVDESRAPLRLKSLKFVINYVFDYPFAATPCFLLRLDPPIAWVCGCRTQPTVVSPMACRSFPELRTLCASFLCSRQV